MFRQFKNPAMPAGIAFLLLILSLVFLRQEGTRNGGERSSPVNSITSTTTAEVQDPAASFRGWVEEYFAASADRRAGLLERGVALARERAGEVERAIELDPERALANAISSAERERLPEEIRLHLEEPFSLRGAMDVFPLCNEIETGHEWIPDPVGEGHRRQGVRIELSDRDGQILDTYVFGRREGAFSREMTRVQGIRLNGKAALREELFTRILPQDLPSIRERYTLAENGTPRDFLTGKEIEGEPVIALSGGQLFAFENASHLQKVNESAARLEKLIGMESGSQLLFSSRLTTGHAPLDLDAIEAEGEVASAITSDTTRSAIVILVDFSDKTGTPINATTLQDRFDGEVHDQVASMSFRQTGIDATVDPRVFRMPQPTTYYNGTDDGSKKNSALFNDAIAAANAAGLTTTGYNHRCVIFKGIGMGYCGLATVGGNKIWLPCHGSKVIVHELGHNFGLGHASFWTSSNQNPVDPDGSTSEYGDNTSIMGGGGVTSGHFHVQGKRKLGWLAPESQFSIGDADSSSIRRIYRFDHEDTDDSNVRRAIRVKKGDDEFYWIGYRQRFTGSSYQNYLKGIQIHWEQKGKSKSWLVDTNPGGTKNDSGVALGKTYSDFVAGVHITPLERGGSSPDQWMDVAINVGAFPANQPPEGTLNLPERYAVNKAVPIGSSVTDPDDDPLAYFVGFNTTVMGNDAELPGRNYAFASTGAKAIAMTVSDRKGGTLSLSGSVQIQNEIAAPQNLSATDGDYHDRTEVSWSAVPGAAQYVVYRSTTSSPFGAKKLTTVNAPTVATEDTTATQGVVYTYFVQALASNQASVFSAGNQGERSLGPPGVPAGASASDNLFTDRIRIDWSGGEDATSFEIFRSQTDSFAGAVSIGETGASSFSDTNADAGLPYFYWVVAKNSFGESPSESVSGSKKLPGPSGLAASQGNHPDSVLLQWEPVDNAISYEIYGGDSIENISSPLGTTGSTSFSHIPPSPLALHYYRVRGVAVTGAGEWSSATSGFRTFEGPGSVSATVRRYDDRIRIEWERIQVPGGITLAYEIWRAPAGSEREDAELVATSSDLFFEDTGIVPGQDYEYWIRGVDTNSGNPGGFSAPVAGRRAEQPPYQPDQSVGTSPSRLAGNNLYNLHTGGQSVLQKLPRARPTRFYSGLQNDGLFPDRFKVITSRSDRFFVVRVRELFGSYRVVSASTTAGSYRTGEMPESASQLFEFTTLPKRAAKTRRVRRSYYLWSVSMEDPDHQDKVKASVQTPKPRKRKKGK